MIIRVVKQEEKFQTLLILNHSESLMIQTFAVPLVTPEY